MDCGRVCKPKLSLPTQAQTFYISGMTDTVIPLTTGEKSGVNWEV